MKLARLRRHSQKGAAAVEFALVLPVLLTLVLGAIDWGWYFFVDQIVTNAAREGARAGTLLDPTVADDGDAEDAAQTAAEDYLAGMQLDKTGVTPDVVNVGGTTAVQVTISYPVGSMTGFLTGLLPTHARAIAVMRWQ